MKKIIAALFFAIPFIFPGITYAHAFGQQYTLPIPIWVFLYGGSAAVILSFVMSGIFIDQKKGTAAEVNKIELSRYKLFKILISPQVKFIVSALSFLIFLFLIIAGYIGTQDSSSNISPTLFWVAFLLGFTYLSVVLGNIWQLASPYRSLVKLWESLTRREISGLIGYPRWLAFWPSLVFYYLLIWNEILSSGQAAVPHNLSNLLIGYSIITVFGIIIFGSDSWLKYGEFLGVFFGLVSRISPFEVRGGKLFLRPPLSGLMNEPATHFSQVVFIVFMLASTAFDGFRGTLPWFHFELSIWQNLQGFPGFDTLTPFESLSLFLAPLVFLSAYLLLIIPMKLISRTKLGILDLAKKFGPSLVPIAVVYNIAHYYTLLLTQGQAIVAFVSNPFGWDWDIFGTASFLPNPAIIRADYVWYSQVFFIVLGHIAAVYLAHLVSVKLFPNYRSAVTSQIPMLILMVGYTLTGLWILSQPFSFKG